MTDSLNKYLVRSEGEFDIEVLAKGDSEVKFTTMWLLAHPEHMVGTVRDESIFASPN